jgi:hypothetical protein
VLRFVVSNVLFTPLQQAADRRLEYKIGILVNLGYDGGENLICSSIFIISVPDHLRWCSGRPFHASKLVDPMRMGHQREILNRSRHCTISPRSTFLLFVLFGCHLDGYLGSRRC